MSPVEIIYVVNGLPLHILVVHLVVVLVPVTALSVVLATVWPVARRRLGIVIALMGAALIALVPLTTLAGQWLKDRRPETPLVEAHAELGSALWPWTLSLGILGIVTWLWYFLSDRSDRHITRNAGTRKAVGVLLAILAFGLGGMATYQTVLVGESGSRSVWLNSFSEEPAG